MTTARGSNSATVSERAAAYLAKMPPSVSGQNGHAAAFVVACKLVNGFALSTSEAMPLLMEWNMNCQPQWSEAELRHKLASAERAHHNKPCGYLLSDGSRPTPFRPHCTPPPLEPTPRPLPDRTGFGPGTSEQIQRLAAIRPYHREGLEWAQERGLLGFSFWRDTDCYGVTDASGRILELRRTDGGVLSAVPGTSLGERKSHAVKGSQKAWPLGIMESQDFASIALVEGLPDFLTAHYVALREQASDFDRRDARCAPVAMLSASPAIHADALPLFKGKAVRIFPHSEVAGLKGAVKWQAQLVKAGAAHVDVFDFSAYRRTDASPVNDLWEFIHDLHPDEQLNPVTWRILP